MVIYNLRCGTGHCFEGWFDSADGYEEERAAATVTCPLCGTTEVAKLPHASAIGRGSSSGDGRSAEMATQARHLMLQVAEVIRNSFEDVGSTFATRALRFHRGEEKPRAIRGTATAEETRELAEEGVPFLKLALPEYDA